MALPVSPVMQRLAPQSGTAFVLARGDVLHIVDPFGCQVADVMAFDAHDRRARLSSGRSIDYASTTRLTVGHILYSNRSVPMFTIVEDTVGVHDFLLTPCSPDTFRIIYGSNEPHPSCLENLATALAPHGIDDDDIGTTFNAFMNVEMAADGSLRVLPPLSRADDRIALRAECDLLVGLTACSAEQSNGYAFKPIDWSITPG